MLKMSELNTIIPEAKERFVQQMSAHTGVRALLDETPLRLCSRANCRQKYEDAIRRCGSYSAGFSTMTCGELIYGRGGSEILLYQYRFDHPTVFKRVLWHEWGHLLSNRYIAEINSERIAYFERRYASNDPYYHEHLPAEEREYQERLAFGTQLWGEFISDAICNLVADDEPQSIAWHLQEQMARQLIDAVGKLPIQIDTLAHYCSMVLTDPTIEQRTMTDEGFSIGFEFIPDYTAKKVDELLCTLADQLNEDQICSISKDSVLAFGAVVNEIWAANSFCSSELMDMQ